MRLFIAINFEDDVRNKITDLRDELKIQAKSGNFTRDENIHLTLVFLGEVSGSQVTVVEKIIEEIDEEPFELEFGEIGCFKRKYGGDIWWLGCKKNKILMRIQRQLSERLIEEGFNIEKRGFKPHLTLGREVILNSDSVFSSSEHSIISSVCEISLMLSQRINGKLIYTPLYEKPLWYK